MAKVYLESTDTAFTVNNNNTAIYGAAGDQVVTIASGVTGVTYDQNTERVVFAGASSAYTYMQSGNQILVYSGTTLVATIPVQGDTNGTQLTFTNGTANAILTSGVMALGGTTVSSTAAATVTPTTAGLDTTVKTPVTTTSTTPTFSVAATAASVSEGSSATFTISLNAAQSSTTTVAYTLAGTGGATLGTDTTTVANGTATFAAGEVSKTITVPVTFDTTVETGEGMTLTLSSPSTGAVLGTSSAAVAFTDPVAPTFTLTSNATAGAATEEGNAVTYTITPSGVTDKAYTFTLSTIGDTVGGVATAASATDFSPASQTVTFAAGISTAQTVNQTITNDGVSEGLEGYKTSLLDANFAAVASKTGLITDPTSGTAGTVGTTYTLTTSADNLNGTTGNDTFVADNSVSTTASAADSVNGGDGTDTLKIYSKSGTVDIIPTITSIETLYVNGGAAANVFDISAKSSITSLVVDGQTAASTYTLKNQAITLQNSAVGATIGSATTDTAQSVTVSALSAGTIDLTGTGVKTATITSTGTITGGNVITTLNNTGAVLATLNVDGSTALTLTAGAAPAGTIKTVNASTDTGGFTYDKTAGVANAAFAFTGGSGNDTLKLKAGDVALLSAGTQIAMGTGTDKVDILDLTAALDAAYYTKINAMTGVEVLGLNAAQAVDASSLTSIKSFALDTDAIQSITNMATASSVAVTAAHTATFASSGAVGVSDLALTIGTATTAGLNNSGIFTIGQTAVALSSLGTNAAVNQSTFATADNSTYTITGNNDLTVVLGTVTAIGSKFDATNFTGKLNITGNTHAFSAGSSMGDVFIGGSAADTLKVGLNSSTMTGNGGADTFDVSVAVAGANQAAGAASFATIEITTITDFTKGDKLKFTSATTLGKIDISSAASLGAALDLLVANNASDLKWGVYAGNTYIVDDVNAASTVQSDDIIVKLTGTLDLAASTIASNTLTFV